MYKLVVIVCNLLYVKIRAIRMNSITPYVQFDTRTLKLVVDNYFVYTFDYRRCINHTSLSGIRAIIKNKYKKFEFVFIFQKTNVLFLINCFQLFF